ncbi:hypothetical protein [Kaistia sp. MMO-174]|uniref:hypothetical protein n=1 Tax=Kaistia sp. MMO-174 TaxID=3081256 RepID=UPI00301834C6
MPSLKSRHFDPITVPAEAGRRRVHRITCGGCGATNDVSANTECGSRAHSDLLKIWRRGGWTIGPNPRRDRCPGCSSAHRRTKRARAIPIPEVGMSTAPNEPAPAGNGDGRAAPRLVSVADIPRTPSFDDRRIINAKLEEVYLDEKRGYGPGWTDQKVADDLSVPRKWVEIQREANFGPARDNEDIREAVETAKALREQAEALLRDVRAEGERIRAFGEALAERVAPLSSSIVAVDRRLAAIEKAVR